MCVSLSPFHIGLTQCGVRESLCTAVSSEMRCSMSEGGGERGCGRRGREKCKFMSGRNEPIWTSPTNIYLATDGVTVSGSFQQERLLPERFFGTLKDEEISFGR
jgi:hypothetical protein